jgi:hypothetical protein
LAFRASSHRAVNAIETPSLPCVQISVERTGEYKRDFRRTIESLLVQQYQG